MNRTPRTTRPARTVRTVPALVLAAAALSVGVVGTASADALITGKDIKDGTVAAIDVTNGSLTTADVKNGSLTRSDLRSASRTTVVGTSSTTGVFLQTCTDTALETCAAVRSIGVVPGSQLITATGTIDNRVAGTPAISNRCGLVQGDEVLAEARFTLADNGTSGENAQFTLQQAITVPDASQPVSLRCTEMAGENLQLESADLTSVRTGY